MSTGPRNAQPPPGYSQPPPGYSQPPPGYSQQPVQIIAYAPRPGSEYKGCNAYCCGTVVAGARNVAYLEIISCVISLVFGIYNLTKFFLYPGFFSLGIVQVISMGLSVLNIIFGCIIIWKTLLTAGCGAVVAPIGWTTVIFIRIVVSIAQIVLLVMLLAGVNGKDKSAVALAYTTLIILLIFTVFHVLLYSWFIAVMVGYIRYKLSTKNTTAETAVLVTAVEYDPVMQ